MKDKVINQIIKNLIPLRTLYPEIDIITNDLLIDKLDSLEDFLDKQFKDINYSSDLKDLITSLVEKNILPNTYLEVIQGDIKNIKLNTIDPYNYQNAIFLGFKPLNVKSNNLETIKINISKGVSIKNISILRNDVIHPKLTTTPMEVFENYNPNREIEHDKLEVENENESEFEIPTNSNNNDEHPKLIPISDYVFPDISTPIKDQNQKLKIVENNIETKKEKIINEHPKLTPIDETIDDEILSLEDTQIEKLRKMILNAQLNYLNNATSFIEELELKEEVELYQTLLSLNDIRYIHHSISKLSTSALNRLLIYVEELLKENSHNSINIFIEEAIKKILHDNKQKKM